MYIYIYKSCILYMKISGNKYIQIFSKTNSIYLIVYILFDCTCTYRYLYVPIYIGIYIYIYIYIYYRL